MAGTALLSSSEFAATRARVLKGSISYLLYDLIDACSEEGMSCCGSQRKQLARQIGELTRVYRTFPKDSNCRPGDIEVLDSIADQLEGPEVAPTRLVLIQQEFLRLLHPTRRNCG